jgi:hypothetical protein
MRSLDSNNLSYKSELISNWVLLAGSLVLAAPVIFLKIKDHVNVEDDLQTCFPRATPRRSSRRLKSFMRAVCSEEDVNFHGM